eukprot:s9342_g2.t1
MAAQDWGGVVTYDVPSGVYDDFLEHFLVLSCARRLYMRCNGAAPPRHIGMMSRNDLVGWAASFLQNPDRQMFLDYADQLATAFFRAPTSDSPAAYLAGLSGAQSSGGFGPGPIGGGHMPFVECGAPSSSFAAA